MLEERGDLGEIHLKMSIKAPSEYLPLFFWKIAEPGILLLFPDKGIPTLQLINVSTSNLVAVWPFIIAKKNLSSHVPHITITACVLGRHL